jgi:hypothetical protein
LLSANRRFPLNLRPHYNSAAPEVDFTGLVTFNLVLIAISRRGRKGPAAPASLGARSCRTR